MMTNLFFYVFHKYYCSIVSLTDIKRIFYFYFLVKGLGLFSYPLVKQRTQTKEADGLMQWLNFCYVINGTNTSYKNGTQAI